MKLGWIILALCCTTLCFGEDGLRIWRTQSGQHVEGRFVRILLGKVQLETADGEKVYLPLEDLSKWDKKHLSTIFIPEVRIRFSDSSRSKFRSKNALADDIIRIVTGTVTVTAKEEVESDTLSLEMYLVGEEVATDDYKLMKKGAMPLKFTEENDYTCEMFLETESRKYMEYNYELRGCLYTGYALIILDRKGRVIDLKSDLSWLTKDNLEKLRAFDEEDFFNDQLKKRPIPRPKYSKARVGVQ